MAAVEFEHSNHIATVTINRPEARKVSDLTDSVRRTQPKRTFKRPEKRFATVSDRPERTVVA